MNRRTFLTFGLAAAASAAAGAGLAHTPYGHWTVYRRKHLVVGCHRKDPRTYVLAKRVVAVLEDHLPEARARVARGPFAGRLASLIATDQLDFAVLAEGDAVAMAAGEGAFAAYGTVPLRLIGGVDDRILVAHARVPARHAWLVTGALRKAEILQNDRPVLAGIADHPGSAAFLAGEPEPRI